MMKCAEPIFKNLNATERRGYIYRFVSEEKLLGMFTSRNNVVVNPCKWADPFEDFLRRVTGIPRDGWFGQCWTRKKASDAMWRIYSQDSTAIRIRSTPEKLASASRNPEWRVIIGRVTYRKEKEIETVLRAANAKSADPTSVAQTLLTKRLAFRHEGEVRLLIYAPDTSTANGLLRYSIDPHTLIDQVMLDPRLLKNAADDAKVRIRETTGFAGTIKRSLLYQPPEYRWEC